MSLAVYLSMISLEASPPIMSLGNSLSSTSLAPIMNLEESLGLLRV